MGETKKIAIIGGGPAGCMAAIAARKNGASVTIFERNEKPLKKLLATGNGKCNFTNFDLGVKDYEGSLTCYFDQIYAGFTREDLLAFFKENGILYKEKKGYVYPITEQASTVCEFLLCYLKEIGVRVETNALIETKQFEATKQGVKITCHGKVEQFDAVILATGGVAAKNTGSDGKGLDIAKSLGHHLVNVVPSLVQLHTKDSACEQLAGVRTDACIRLFADEELLKEEVGELQLTDYGISGIPVFQLSRYAGYALKEKKRVYVTIDFLKDVAREDLEKLLLQKFVKKQTIYNQNPREYTLLDFFLGLVNKKIASVILIKLGMLPEDSVSKLSKQLIEQFVALVKCYEMEISKHHGFDHAQVSAGGISATEVSKQLESKLCEKVYFAGEMLDLDGRCGGYNLQWAFSSGYCAGASASV